MINFNISKFLERIKGSRSKGIIQVMVVHDSIMKIMGIDIPIEKIIIKSSVVTLKGTSQSTKSAIYIKKQSLLNEINSGQEIPIIRDIR